MWRCCCNFLLCVSLSTVSSEVVSENKRNLQKIDFIMKQK